MAPGILSETTPNDIKSNDHAPSPLKPTGALDKFDYEDVTPIIGREFPKVNIVDDLLNATNADEVLRELAVTISRRGVVFFRAQDNLTNDLQKTLVHRLGLLTGKPATSTLHIHPVLNNTHEFGVQDAEISTISSQSRKSLFAFAQQPQNKRRTDAAQWHSDIQFEPVPADYTSLRLTQLPRDERGVPVGGDTLWASGYELYDLFSRPWQTFLEGLNASFAGDGFHRAAEANPDKVKIHEGPRGSELNVGKELSAVHPVVRTNPVTGWKSIFALGPFPKRILELHADESEELLAKLKSIVAETHDLQVRFKWKNENDIAIWDNRSAFHTATFDYDHIGERFGNRAVGIGERPFFDPNSKSRTEALAQEAEDKKNRKKSEETKPADTEEKARGLPISEAKTHALEQSKPISAAA